jgi:hypothetical protein
MVVRLDILGAGQLASQLAWVVDQDGEMLRADINLIPLVLQGNQRGMIAADTAVKAGLFSFGHSFSPFWDKIERDYPTTTRQGTP